MSRWKAFRWNGGTTSTGCDFCYLLILGMIHDYSRARGRVSGARIMGEGMDHAAFSYGIAALD
jgi:hypothetical protein